jgi:hypothetical protein
MASRENKQYAGYIKENGLQEKHWVRLEHVYGSSRDRKVWRNARFLSEDVFLTRYNHKRGATLYHVCINTKRWIFYCKVPRGGTHCTECEKPIDESILMLMNLQKLRR